MLTAQLSRRWKQTTYSQSIGRCPACHQLLLKWAIDHYFNWRHSSACLTDVTSLQSVQWLKLVVLLILHCSLLSLLHRQFADIVACNLQANEYPITERLMKIFSPSWNLNFVKWSKRLKSIYLYARCVDGRVRWVGLWVYVGLHAHAGWSMEEFVVTLKYWCGKGSLDLSI